MYFYLKILGEVSADFPRRTCEGSVTRTHTPVDTWRSASCAQQSQRECTRDIVCARVRTRLRMFEHDGALEELAHSVAPSVGITSVAQVVIARVHVERVGVVNGRATDALERKIAERAILLPEGLRIGARVVEDRTLDLRMRFEPLVARVIRPAKRFEAPLLDRTPHVHRDRYRVERASHSRFAVLVKKKVVCSGRTQAPKGERLARLLGRRNASQRVFEECLPKGRRVQILGHGLEIAVVEY